MACQGPCRVWNYRVRHKSGTSTATGILICNTFDNTSKFQSVSERLQAIKFLPNPLSITYLLLIYPRWQVFLDVEVFQGKRILEEFIKWTILFNILLNDLDSQKKFADKAEMGSISMQRRSWIASRMNWVILRAVKNKKGWILIVRKTKVCIRSK